MTQALLQIIEQPELLNQFQQLTDSDRIESLAAAISSTMAVFCCDLIQGQRPGFAAERTAPEHGSNLSH